MSESANQDERPYPVLQKAIDEGRINGSHKPDPLKRMLRCPVHTGTPEPCPECESKIAAGL